MNALPEHLLQTRRGAVVDVSRDAGGFYCEHCFLAARLAAADDVIVGFLHVPPETEPGEPWRRRHQDTREVLTAALRGLLDTTTTPLRVLLTGFRPWDKVVRNPSGDFVAHVGNIDAMVAALGGRVTGSMGGVRLAMVGARRLDIARVVLPVDDRAIDEGPLSVQAAMAKHRPGVVISMGVHRTAARYRVEVRATDRRLRMDGSLAHDETITRASTSLPDDERLAWALVSGSRSLASTSTGSPPSMRVPAPAS